MKLSVSLSDDDIRVVDELVREQGLPSRSAAVQQAIRELRLRSLRDDYAEAFTDWSASDDAHTWDRVAGDGLGDAAR